MTSWAECAALTRTIEQIGVPLPDTLSRCLFAAAAIDRYTTTAGYDLGADLSSAMLKDDKAVTTAFARAIEAKIRHDAIVELMPAVCDVLAQQFTAAILGDAGAELIEALRPKWDQAAQAIAAVPFSPDTAKNLGAVVELGDEAVAAYRALPRHRAALDTIRRQILWALTTQFIQPLPYAWERATMPHLSWVIDGTHKADLAAAVALDDNQANLGPGGVWHSLVNAGFRLKLNTPAEALAVQHQWIDGRQAEQERRQQAEQERAKQLTRKLAGAR